MLGGGKKRRLDLLFSFSYTNNLYTKIKLTNNISQCKFETAKHHAV